MLKSKNLLFALLFSLTFTLSSFAQNEVMLMVYGTVTDQTGVPLPGVTIRRLGTSYATTSDGSGKYHIKAALDETLEFSFVGMISKKRKVTGDPINVSLKEDTKLLGEVVVTRYQKINTRVFTGATKLVKMDEVKIGGMSDVSKMLEGRVPGLSTQTLSGTFGSAPRINIRGGASILGNAQPLWVVNGAVYEDIISLSPDELASGDAVTLVSSAISGINPADIEDIQVLKDASATAIYGARALNGVIVVTTKKAKKEMPLQVHYSLETGIRSIPSYRSLDRLDSRETMSVYAEMKAKGYFSIQESLYGRRGGIFHQMYRDMVTVDRLTGQYLLPNTPDARTRFLRNSEIRNTDWFGELFTHRPVMIHSLSFSGGGEHVTSYASIGLHQDMGWSIADKVRRLTGNLRSDFYLSPTLSAVLSAQGSVRKQLAPGTLPQRQDYAKGTFRREFDLNPYSYALNTPRNLAPRNEDGSLLFYRNNWAPFNILNEYQNNHTDLSLLDYKLQGEITWKAVKGLEVKGLLSYRSAKSTSAHSVSDKSNLISAYRAAETPEVRRDNIFLLKNLSDKQALPKESLKDGGLLREESISMGSLLARLSADYKWRRDEHDLSVFSFGEVRSTDRRISQYYGYGIQYDRGNQIFPPARIFEKLSQEETPYFSLREMRQRGITLSGTLTYGYAGRYIVTGLINAEGSNTGGSGRAQWLPTWNIGAKWNLDAEPWWADVNKTAISQLSLRTSYGLTAKMNELAMNSGATFENALTHRRNPEWKENALKFRGRRNLWGRKKGFRESRSLRPKCL